MKEFSKNLLLLNIFSFFACGLFLDKALPHSGKDKISPLVAMALLGSRSNSIGANAANPQGTNSTNTSPSNLTYSTTSLQLYLNTVMTTLVPTSTASITSCSSSPSLPIGLNLDSTTCAISGTPTTTSALTGYTITASNASGTMTVNMDITVNPIWIQEAYIKAPNVDGADYFGYAVSLSADTLVVGAYAEDSNQTIITNGTIASADNSSVDSGAVYVFKRTGNLWVNEAYIKPPNPDAADYFGYSVSISDDTIAVGAKQEDSNQVTITNGNSASADNSFADSGAVYIFRRTGATWTQEAFIKPPNSDAGDNFGVSVSIESDTLVVGALYEDSNQTTITNGSTANTVNSAVNAGAVYVFKRNGTLWVQEAYIKAPNAEGADTFGSCVSISSDIIVVGAWNEDSNQTTITNGNTASSNNLLATSGAVYVFKRTGTTWAREAYIKAPNVNTNDAFGYSLSISSDAIVVGAYGEDSNQTIITNGTTASADNSSVDSGAVYVFKRTGTTWAQEAYIKAPNADAGDYFGYAVSISGSTIVVGAYYENSMQTTITNGPTASSDNSQNNTGAAYVFKRTRNRWEQDAYLKAPNPRTNNRFGNSVSISNDTIAVGSYWESSNQSIITNGPTASSNGSLGGAGAVYVFKRKYQ